MKNKNTNSIANKKRLYNMIMAAAILVILLSGIMIAGHLKGWFGGRGTVVTDKDGVQRTVEIRVETKKGNGNLRRNGLSMNLEQGASLGEGDQIETLRGSAVTLVSGKNTLYLDEQSRAEIQVTEEGTVRLRLEAGGVFAVAQEPFALELMDTEVTTEAAVFSASAPYGSARLHIFEKTVQAGGQEAAAGQAVNLLKGDGGTEIQIAELSLQTLNSFELACAAMLEDSALCFTPQELEELAAQRRQTVADAGNGGEDKEGAERGAKAPGSSGSGQAAEECGGSGSGDGRDGAKAPGSSDSGQAAPGSSGSGSGSAAGTGDNPGGAAGTGDNTGSAEGTGGNSGSGGSSGDNFGGQGSQGSSAGADGSGGSGSGEPEASGSCTITIVCDTILDNMENLTEGKDGYVPSNGVILSSSAMSFTDGETVFDVLKRACSSAGIQLEYSWTPMYNSYYVEGINNLYEFDCGGQSGWMYKVNGWFPNYGCSSYTLAEGDAIVWCYTCNGLGEDVGGGF